MSGAIPPEEVVQEVPRLAWESPSACESTTNLLLQTLDRISAGKALSETGWDEVRMPGVFYWVAGSACKVQWAPLMKKEVSCPLCTRSCGLSPSCFTKGIARANFNKQRCAAFAPAVAILNLTVQPLALGRAMPLRGLSSCEVSHELIRYPSRRQAPNPVGLQKLCHQNNFSFSFLQKVY